MEAVNAMLLSLGAGGLSACVPSVDQAGIAIGQLLHTYNCTPAVNWTPAGRYWELKSAVLLCSQRFPHGLGISGPKSFPTGNFDTSCRQVQAEDWFTTAIAWTPVDDCDSVLAIS
jgi:hypothetical protein